MAEKNYKVGEPVPILYQAPNAESGLSNVTADILVPFGYLDSNFPPVSLIERGNTGTYIGEFTADEQGEWQAICHKDGGDGQVTKRYSVGAHNVDSVGEGVGSVGTKVDAVDNKVENLDGDVVALDTKVVAVEDKVESIEIKVDGIVTSVASLDTPPMVS